MGVVAGSIPAQSDTVRKAGVRCAGLAGRCHHSDRTNQQGSSEVAKAEPRGRIPQLYRDMQIGDCVIVNIERERAFHLLRSAWKRHRRRDHIADGYPVPWLYLEPRGANRTLIVRMASEEGVKAARTAYLRRVKK